MFVTFHRCSSDQFSVFFPRAYLPDDDEMEKKNYDELPRHISNLHHQ